MAGEHRLVGTALGGYRLETFIGAGAAGSVFLGRGADGSARAIKVLNLPSPLSLLEEAEFRRRFVLEAQTMRQLRHPNILFVEAFGEDIATGALYIVMPYIQTGTLEDRMHGQLPFAEVLGYLRPLAAAVDYGNDFGFIHRDIKPANILIGPTGQVYLSDFGIVKIFEMDISDHTTMGTVLGTPMYMAPEQARGLAISRAADVYSVGMVAYHLIAGIPAFQGQSVAEVLTKVEGEAPPPPRNQRPDLSEAGQAVLLCCLAKDPAQRYTTATKFVDSLELAFQPDATYSPEIMGPTFGGLNPPRPFSRPMIPNPPSSPPYYAPSPLQPPSAPPYPFPPSAPYPGQPPSMPPYGQPASAPYGYPPPAGQTLPPDAAAGRPRGTLPGSIPPSSPSPSRYGSAPIGQVAGLPNALTPTRFPRWLLPVAALLVVVIVAGSLGLAFALRGGSSAATRATPTPTNKAIGFVYTTLVPGICTQDATWQSAPGTKMGNVDNGYDCVASGLTLRASAFTTSSTSSLTSVTWKNPFPDAGFTAGIMIHNLTNGCAGIGFDDRNGAYIAFICETGQWFLDRYDANGKHLSPDPGTGSLQRAATRKIAISATATNIAFAIDGTVVKSIDRQTGGGAAKIVLAYFSTIFRSACTVSNFSFQVDS